MDMVLVWYDVRRTQAADLDVFAYRLEQCPASHEAANELTPNEFCGLQDLLGACQIRISNQTRRFPQVFLDDMGKDNLRSELRASFKNRAVLYYLIFDELRNVVGEQQAISILKRAIYRRGEQIGQQFSHLAPNDLNGLKEAFLKIIPDEGRLFDPKVVQCNEESLVIHLDQCPLKDAWEELGLEEHDKTVMCEIAGEIDKGTFEAAGFAFEPDTWQPGRNGCCLLKIKPKP